MTRCGPRVRPREDLRAWSPRGRWKAPGVSPREKPRETGWVEEDSQVEPREDPARWPVQECEDRDPTANQGELMKVAAAEEG